MSSFSRTQFLLALLPLAACTSLGGGTGPHAGGRTAVTVVERARESSIDTAGTLSIVVRDVDEPNLSLREAVVVVAPSGGNLESPTTPPVLTDREGRATFVHLSDGRYDVLIRRVGYERLQIALDRRPRCREVLEVYLGQAPNCLFECPITPALAVLTTCRRPA